MEVLGGFCGAFESGKLLAEAGLMRILRTSLLAFTAMATIACAGDDSSGSSLTEGSTSDGSTSEGPTSKGSTGEGSTSEGSTSEGSTSEGSTSEGSTSRGSTSEGSTGATEASASATAPSSDPTDTETGCENSAEEIDPGELLPGAVGVPYEVFFAVGGSVGSQPWEVEGEFPAGLLFDPEESSLTGIPEVAGESQFSLTINYGDSGDGCSNQPAYASYTLVIEP